MGNLFAGTLARATGGSVSREEANMLSDVVAC